MISVAEHLPHPLKREGPRGAENMTAALWSQLHNRERSREEGCEGKAGFLPAAPGVQTGEREPGGL